MDRDVQQKRNIGLVMSLSFFLFATIVVVIFGIGFGFGIGDMLANWGRGCFAVLEFIMLSILLWICAASIVEASPIGRVINRLSGLVSSHGSAGLLVTSLAVIFGWINWIFGIYFSLLLVREIARVNLKRGIKLHYPYLLSCAFSASAVGFLGILSPVQLYLADNITQIIIGDTSSVVPIPISETIFSSTSLKITIILLLILPLISYLIRPNGKDEISVVSDEEQKKPRPDDIIYHRPKPRSEQVFADKLDNSYIITLIASGVGLIGITYHLLFLGDPFTFKSAIFLLFMIGLLLNKRPIEYVYKMRENANLSVYLPIGVFFGAGLSTLIIYIGLDEQISNAISALGVLIPILCLILSFTVSLVIHEPSTVWVLLGPFIINALLINSESPILSIIALMCGLQISRFLKPYIYLDLLGFSNRTQILEMGKYLRINMAIVILVYVAVISCDSYFGVF